MAREPKIESIKVGKGSDGKDTVTVEYDTGTEEWTNTVKGPNHPHGPGGDSWSSSFKRRR